MRFGTPHYSASVFIVSVLFGLAASPATAESGANRLFDSLAGTWAGSGSVSAVGGGTEPLRCRAGYSPSDSSHMSLQLRCASDDFKIEITSNISRSGNRIQGDYQEATFGTSGRLSGAINGSRIEANIDGGETTAHISLSVRGDVQSINLVSQGQIAGSASVVLRRE